LASYHRGHETDPASRRPAEVAFLVRDQDRPAPETPGIVIGNTTPKYTSRNPAIRWLTERWVANLEGAFDRIGDDPAGAPKQALEVGCGEGVIAGKLHDRFRDVVALDLPDAGLRRDWRAYRGPSFLHADAHVLPFEDRSFDLVVAVEVLEHLTDPAMGLREMARVGRRHLVLSVPQEPVFRSCNLIAGRYVRDLGNTPGHLNHWSKRGFVRFVSTVAEVREVTTPFPWTTVWAVLPD
jgi:SAM-dependent methyltransferase